MKKMICFAICLLMVLSFTTLGCAENGMAQDFDAGWAGAGYVMPVPAPPIEGFEIREFIGSSGGDAIQIVTNVESLDKETLEIYRQTIESLGFFNDIRMKDADSAHGYEFSARNGKGDYVYINYDTPLFVFILEFAKLDASNGEAALFDTAWAGNSYVMPVPEPPFAASEVTYSADQNMYTIVDASERENRADYNKLAAYCNVLKSVGYTEVETEMLTQEAFQSALDTMGVATLFVASHADGYRALVNWEGNTPMVWVYCPAKVEEEPETIVTVEETSGDDGLPQPPAVVEWDYEVMEKGIMHMYQSNDTIAKQEIIGFVNQMTAAGYTITEDTPDGRKHWWTLENPDAAVYTVTISYRGLKNDEENGWCSIEYYGDK